MMKFYWPRTVKIFWDPWNNVPVIKPKQEEIDILYALKLSEPGDARPAFRGDLEKLRAAVVYEFGDDKFYSRVISGNLVLLNKVPHWDVMYEVVCSGNVVGQLFYDPYLLKWRFRLTFQGAYIAVEENIAEVVKCTKPIYVGKILEYQVGASSRQLVVVDEKGAIRGLGEVGQGNIIISKVFHDRVLPIETSKKPATIHEVLKRNDEGLQLMEEKAIKYLQRLQSRFKDLKPAVSYSGGKDSLVALELAHKAYGSVDVLFNDTGLELPETLRNVEEVSKFYNCNIRVAQAGDIFWKSVGVFGPPGKDYRWCCKIAKLVPIAKLSKSMWPSGALNIVGQRAYESLNRAKSPLIWRNKWIPHLLSTTPIQYWSQLACWLYIFKYKLPYNKLYEEGFDRLGCFLCPSCSLAEFENVKQVYPDLWGRWEAVLEEWRRKLNLPHQWITLGLWRWLTPATAKKRTLRSVQEHLVDWKREYAERLEKSKIGIKPIEVTRVNDVLIIKFNHDIIPSNLAGVIKNNLANLNFKLKEGDPMIVKKGSSVVEISGNVIKLYPANEDSFEDLVDVLKIIYRSRGCVLCGSCVLWSKRGSIKLTREGPVLTNVLNWKDSRVFLEVCPISEQLVEKILVPMITGDYKSFKRKTRRRPVY